MRPDIGPKGADIHVDKSNSSDRGWDIIILSKVQISLLIRATPLTGGDINTVKGADIHVDKSNSSNRGGYKYCQKC